MRRLDRICVVLTRVVLVAGIGLMLLADIFYISARRIER